MLLSQNLFTAIIILGIVGGMVSLTATVMILITEKEVDFLEVEKKRANLEALLTESKILHLSAQIQPHFLFNTLNTISTLIRLGKNQEAEQAIYSISSLLRYHLDHKGTLISLKEELTYAEQYLTIQQMRFGSRLRWSIDAPDEILNLHIPVLVIQPLIENACIHGVEPSIEGGEISIAAAFSAGMLKITVEDDGVGIRQEVIEEFDQWKKDQKVSSDNSHIGLRNVHARLAEQFGAESGLIIKKADKGTISEISMSPIKSSVLEGGGL